MQAFAEDVKDKCSYHYNDDISEDGIWQEWKNFVNNTYNYFTLQSFNSLTLTFKPLIIKTELWFPYKKKIKKLLASIMY